jgi:phenylpropionate dioxygenase-like ring-hydroxylating dioxygenase large terminal subunit
MFVRNIWYPIFWSENIVAGQLIPRRVLDEPLIFFRSAQGRVAALADVCPHRQAPLRLGRLVGQGHVQCGYHGLEFDADGRCVINPHGPIPPKMRARAYPVTEKDSIVWVWMGDREADPSSIPDFGLMGGADDGLARGRSYLTMNANYLLLADNLLDLSHANYLHEGILGMPEHSSAKVSVEQEGDVVVCRRMMESVPVPRMHDLMFKQDGQPIDMWNEIRWAPPSCIKILHGYSRPGGEDACEFTAVHLLAPETETSSHYLNGIVRIPTKDDEEIGRQIAEMREFAFAEQDRVMLEAQQSNHSAMPEAVADGALLSIDAAAVRMRRIVQRLAAAEAV